MPVLIFAKGHRPPLTVEKGSNLMQALLAAGVPVASSCHGDGVCAKCRLKITPLNAVTPANEIETFLAERFQLASGFRISCQVQVLSDLTLDATYW